MCERYEIGATPLREALNRLSAEELVRREEQRGFRVAPVSLSDLAELTLAMSRFFASRDPGGRGNLAFGQP